MGGKPEVGFRNTSTVLEILEAIRAIRDAEVRDEALRLYDDWHSGGLDHVPMTGIDCMFPWADDYNWKELHMDLYELGAYNLGVDK